IFASERERLLVLGMLRDGCLPIRKFAEAYDLVNAEVFEEHSQHEEPLSLAGEDTAHELDLLGCHIEPPLKLLLCPTTSLSANVPSLLAHERPPRCNAYW